MRDKVLEVNNKKFYVLDELLSDNHYVMCLDVTNKATETENIILGQIVRTGDSVSIADIKDPVELKKVLEIFMANSQRA